MKKFVLLLVSLTSGFLKAAKPGAGEGIEGSGQSAQAARDVAANLAREAELRKDDLAEKERLKKLDEEKGHDLKKRPSTDQGVEQSGQQGKRPKSPGMKSGDGDDGDAQATQLAQDARIVNDLVFDPEDSDENNELKTQVPTPKISAEDVIGKVKREDFDGLKQQIQEFVNGNPVRNKAVDSELKKVILEPSIQKRMAEEATQVQDIVQNVEDISVISVKQGVRIIVGEKAVTVNEASLAFLPEKVFTRILFYFRREAFKKELENIDPDVLRKIGASLLKSPVASKGLPTIENMPVAPEAPQLNSTKDVNKEAKTEYDRAFSEYKKEAKAYDKKLKTYYKELKEFILKDSENMNAAMRAKRSRSNSI